MRCVVFLLFLLLLSCGDDVSSGNGSETTNGFISVVDTNHNPVPNTVVRIFAEEYNPVTDDSTDGYYTAITNENGVAEFTINQSGRYNIYSEKGEKQKVLARAVSFDNTDTLEHTVTLSKPGELDVFIPSTYDTNAAYLFVEGTNFKARVDSTLVVAGGYRVVNMGNVPAGSLPTITYYDSDESAFEKKIVDTVVIESDSVNDVAYTYYDVVKPVWAFSLALSVHSDVVSDLGGLEETKELINNYYNWAMEWVNGENDLSNPESFRGFDGVLHFSVDTIHVFSHSMVEESLIPLDEDFDYRIIYGNELGDTATRASLLKRAESYYIYHEDSKWLFDTDRSPGVPQIFGQFRGALLLSHQNVDSNDNTVAKVEYWGGETIMNVKKSKVWHPYNVAMVNHNKDRVGDEIAYSVEAIPDTIIFEFRDTLGNIMPDVEVHLHEREWVYNKDEPINPTAIINSRTNESGKLIVGTPLFTNEEKTAIINGNILIEVIDENGTKFFDWLPLLEVGDAYVNENMKTRYIKEVSF